MPPWHAQEAARQGPTISAAEIDDPYGSRVSARASRIFPPVALRSDWPKGKPDLVFQLPEAVRGRQIEITQEFTIATTRSMWIRSVDLLPGASRSRTQRFR